MPSLTRTHAAPGQGRDEATADERYPAMLWGMAYPDHVCACADDDLSQASLPLGTPDGRWVDISCGLGHRRRITRNAWEAELARRRKEPPHA